MRSELWTDLADTVAQCDHEVSDLPVTCVSLYGLTDELSEASVHRSLSEISPLFSNPRYKEFFFLGGDLNTSTQWPQGPHLDGDKLPAGQRPLSVAEADR